MPSKITIMAELKARVGNTTYAAWYIGLTRDPQTQQKYLHETENQDISRWTTWFAASLPDARGIESYFVDKGMKACCAEDNLASSRNVYIYIF